MSSGPSINWKTVALRLWALGVGMCVAVVLVASYVFIKAKLADDAATRARIC